MDELREKLARALEALKPFAVTANQLDRDLPHARDQRVTLVNPIDDHDVTAEQWPLPDEFLIFEAWRYHDPLPASEMMGLHMEHFRAAAAAFAELSEDKV